MNQPLRLVIALSAVCLLVFVEAPVADSQNNLASDAKLNCEDYLKQYFTISGDDWYIGIKGPNGQIYRLFRQIRWEPVPLPVSQADRLNGIEWRGSMELYAGLSRDYTNHWDKWIDNVHFVECWPYRNNGAWITKATFYGYGDLSSGPFFRPRTDQIPQ